jgi:hypothetical protein
MRQHKLGKSYLGNCWLFALKMVLAGRSRAIWIRMGRNYRPHPMVLTAKGNFVHLSSDNALDLYFLVQGRVQVLRPCMLRSRRYLRLRTAKVVRNTSL